MNYQNDTIIVYVRPNFELQVLWNIRLKVKFNV